MFSRSLFLGSTKSSCFFCGYQSHYDQKVSKFLRAWKHMNRQKTAEEIIFFVGYSQHNHLINMIHTIVIQLKTFIHNLPNPPTTECNWKWLIYLLCHVPDSFAKVSIPAIQCWSTNTTHQLVMTSMLKFFFLELTLCPNLYLCIRTIVLITNHSFPVWHIHSTWSSCQISLELSKSFLEFSDININVAKYGCARALPQHLFSFSYNLRILPH